MKSFPIDSLQNDILNSLENHSILILKSSPGSGKTTRVPLFLLKHFSKKIYVLEPRRLAAKLASEFVAKSLNEEVGNTIGHIFKYENKTSPKTRVTFFTEGTFLRILKDTKSLSEVDVIILDEFHERHLTTDTTLSYLLYLKKDYPQLKIIIMSATLNTSLLELFLKSDYNVLEQTSKRFEITIKHLPNDTLVLKESLEKKVLNAIFNSMEINGDVLVFLPGMYEINQCAELITNSSLAHLLAVFILHGDLGNETLGQAFQTNPLKKIILSTNIAESSLTINGIRIVIDSGLHRTSRINPNTLNDEIVTLKISQSSAIQRAHRANRENHGHVFRLYPEMDFLSRDKFEIPEILRCDISDLIIRTFDLLKIPISNLNFLDSPKTSEIEKSIRFLTILNLIHENQLTETGKTIGSWPYSPRLSKILYTASLHDINTFNEVLDEIAHWIEPRQTNRFIAKAKTFINVSEKYGSGDKDKIFLTGFIDQLCRIKNQNDFEVIHRNGEVYKISKRIHHQIDRTHPLWIIIETNNRNDVNKMLPVEEEWLYELDHFPISEKSEITFINNKFYEETITHVDAIILDRIKSPINSQQFTNEKKERIKSLIKKEFQNYLSLKLNSNEYKRLVLLAKINQFEIESYQFLDYFDEQFSYLFSIINGNSNWPNEVFNHYLIELKTKIDPQNKIDLERSLPLFLTLSDRRKISVNYELNQSPWAQSYIQDFYGLKEVPKILNGAETLTIHLIGPHKRALQVTKDLNSFWNKTYKEMYNELKREYPRHYWPLDPINSSPILLLRQVPIK